LQIATQKRVATKEGTDLVFGQLRGDLNNRIMLVQPGSWTGYDSWFFRNNCWFDL